MRKIICILLLTALLLSTFTACSAPNSTPDNVANDSSADTTADGAPTAPTDTTPSDTSPVFDESIYKFYGGLVCKGRRISQKHEFHIIRTIREREIHKILSRFLCLKNIH